jgi:hypothetical protein
MVARSWKVFGLVLLLLLTGCSEDTTKWNDKKVTLADLSEINIRDYATYPQKLVYEWEFEGGKGNKQIHVTKWYENKNYITNVKDGILPKGMNHFYAVTKNSLVEEYNYRDNELMLTNQAIEWNSDYGGDIVKKTITGIGLTIETKAGTFFNVIEVTKDERIKTKNDEVYLSKNYYAPKIGLILTKVKLPAMSEYKVYKQLIEYTGMPKTSKNNNNSLSQKNRSKTLLIDAAIKGDIEVVKSLLQQQVDPNIKNELAITPLMESSRNGHQDIVNLLLNAKADPNIRAMNGETALMWAVDEGDLEIVKALLQAGADPNFQGEFFRTALMSASEKGYIEIVKELLNANANFTLKNDSPNGQRTALQMATDAGNKEIVELLQKAGAKN